jgi:leucyl aminopeptidase (aminopeptidase T)
VRINLSEEKTILLRKAADKLLERANAKGEEEILIIADEKTDTLVIDAVYQASFETGNYPTLIIQPQRPDSDMFTEPPRIVSAAMKSYPDLVIPLAMNVSPYTNTYTDMLRNSRVLGFIYPTVNSMIEYLLHIDYDLTDKICDSLTALMYKTTECRFTSDAGTDLKMTFGDRHVADDPGKVEKKGDENYLPGACVCAAPIEESWEGTITYDALVYPPIGNLSTPVKLNIEHGVVKNITGGQDAKIFEHWLKSFNDPNMFRMCHIGIGTNPYFASLCGRKTLDERICGIVGAGLGTNDIPVFEGTIRAKAHTDGYMRCANLYFDDEIIIERGRFVHPDLKDLTEAFFCMDPL